MSHPDPYPNLPSIADIDGRNWFATFIGNPTIGQDGVATRFSIIFQRSSNTRRPRMCEILGHYSFCVPGGRYPSTLQQHASTTELSNCSHVVTHQNYRAPLSGHIVHCPQALLLKPNIPDCQDFIHEQNLGFEMRRNGESQPYYIPLE